MIPIRYTLTLSTGTVTLQAWGIGVADGHLMELLTLTSTLGELRAEAFAFEADDVEPGVWAAFWRLTAASVAPGSVLPGPLTWGDCLTILDTLWRLNDVEEAEGKLAGLTARAASKAARLRQAQLDQSRRTTRSTSS